MNLLTVKKTLLGALMAASVVAAGCIKSAQTYTIYPDGSGKVEIQMTLMGQAAMMMQGQMGQGGENPADQIRKELQGKVYWTDLTAGPGPAGSFELKGTGYFEDVSQVAPKDGSLLFQAEGDGHKIVLTQKMKLPGGMPGMGGPGDENEMSPEQQAQMEQAKAMMKGMLAGFEMAIRVRMPGDVDSIEGFNGKEGRTAAFKMGEKDVLEMMDSNEKPPSAYAAVSGAPGDIQAEWDAFKVELAAAKAASEGDAEKEEEKESGGDF